MIITAFLQIVTYLMGIALSIFPDAGGLPSDVHSGATIIGGYARTLDGILPFNTLFTVVSIVVSIELLIFAFKSFKWLISHVPFIGGRG